MNKNIKTLSGALIILFIAALAVFLIWTMEKKDSKTTEGPAKNPVEKPIKSSEKSAAEGQKVENIYQNDEYGFQITLPKEHMDYKALIEKGAGKEGVAQIRLAFRTNDISSGQAFTEENSVTHEKYAGYFSPFMFIILNKKEVDSLTSVCTNNPKNSECSRLILGSNNKYGVEIKFTGNAVPKDLTALVDSLRSSEESRESVLNFKMASGQ